MMTAISDVTMVIHVPDPASVAVSWARARAEVRARGGSAGGGGLRDYHCRVAVYVAYVLLSLQHLTSCPLV